MLDPKPLSANPRYVVACKNILDEKFVLKQFNTIQHDFLNEILDEIGAFKRIQHSVQHHKFRMLNQMFDLFKSAFMVW